MQRGHIGKDMRKLFKTIKLLITKRNHNSATTFIYQNIAKLVPCTDEMGWWHYYFWYWSSKPGVKQETSRLYLLLSGTPREYRVRLLYSKSCP